VSRSATAEIPLYHPSPGTGPSVLDWEVDPRSLDGLRVSEEVYWRDYYALLSVVTNGTTAAWRRNQCRIMGPIWFMPGSSRSSSTPERQAFFSRTPDGLYAPIAHEDGVIRSRVLPGFQFRLADLCRQPDPKDLRADSVYADFVLPGYRAAELRAEAEARQEAERLAAAEIQARQDAERRAAAEADRAERLVRRLRELGLDPNAPD
jgi:hypothetical protein